MTNQQLITYIKQTLAYGYSREEVKNTLLDKGWSEKEIDEAFNAVLISPQNTSPAEQIEQIKEVKETIKTKIIALWLVLVGVVGIFLGILSLGGLVMIMGILSPVMPLIQIIFFLVGAIILWILSFYLFKISGLIHRLDREGYKGAMLFFIMMIPSSLIYALSSVIIIKQTPFFLDIIIPLIINGILAYTLYTERGLFKVYSGIHIFKKVLIFLILLLFLMPLGFYTLKFLRIKEEAQIPLPIFEEKEEPVVTEWTQYTNNQFGFQLEYPSNWNIKTYPMEPIYIIIAFAEKELPDYWNPDVPYFWLSIEPITTSASLYDMLKPPFNFKATTLGGQPAVATHFSIATEYRGYVYDLKLRFVKDEYSEISKRVWSSFKFIESKEAIACEEWIKGCAKEGENLCSPCGCRKCCGGLVIHQSLHPYRNTKTNEVVCLENMTSYICVKCGDDVCGKNENWCICPRDCKKPKLQDLTPTNI